MTPSSRALVPMIVILGGITLSCGGDSTRPGPAVTVTVNTNVASALPGQTVNATVTASGGNNVIIDSVTIATTGALTTTTTVPAGVSGSFTVARSYSIPFSVGTGMLTITATARAGNGKGTGQTSVAVADTLHPTLQLTISPPGSVESGDSVIVTLRSSDAAALKYTVLKASGSFSFSDSLDAAYAGFVDRTVIIRIPESASLTSPLHISAASENVGGVVTTATLSPIAVIDTAHPKISGLLTTTHGAGGAVPGDNLTLTATASDRRKLAYVGYRFGPPANVSDSVATSAASYTLTVPIAVAAGWAGASIYSVFARDSVGNRTETVLGNLTVASRSRRPIASAARPGDVRDATIDAKRNRVYMSVPSLGKVEVLSMADMTFATPFSFGASPHGLDLTPGGDSLVIALVETPNIAIVNLSTGATSTMAVTSGSGPDFLRVASNNKVIVTLTFAGSGYGGSFIEANLATGASRNLKTVTEYVPLAAAGNRSRILALIDDSCCPEEGFVYDAATGTIAGDGSTISEYGPWVSADFAGDAFMVRSTVFDTKVHAVTAYGGNLFAGGPSALSSDAKSGYFSTTTGVAHVRFSDGGQLEYFTLGEQPQGMWLSRDGLTLFVVGSSHVYLIDLW